MLGTFHVYAIGFLVVFTRLEMIGGNIYAISLP